MLGLIAVTEDTTVKKKLWGFGAVVFIFFRKMFIHYEYTVK